MRNTAVILALIIFPIHLIAADFFEFDIEKQKTKLAVEYENLAGTKGEKVSLSGFQASYLVKGKGNFASRAFFNFDLQSGARINAINNFSEGEVSPFILSNRASTVFTVPVKKLYLSGGVAFRNKWFKDAGDKNQFIDVFGGEGFREKSYSVHAAYEFTPAWEAAVAAEKSDLNFKDFPDSNSHERALSLRGSRKWSDLKLNLQFTKRKIQYDRLISGGFIPTILPDIIDNGILQKDRFWELGASVELLSSLYFVGGYSYQMNKSNNKGFSYKNHRVSLLFSKELSDSFYFQAFGILQSQDFVEEDLTLPGTILLEENQYNSMAASLVKSLNSSTEIEFGFQKFSNDSSFRELNASKYIVYCAYNYRF